MSDRLLLDASALWRLASSALSDDRRNEVAEWTVRGLLCASTPLLLEVRAGRDLPAADPAELPMLRTTERAEARAVELQRQLRDQHQHLGVPPIAYLIAAIAEDHGATILHYDSDFTRLTSVTDLATGEELLAPIGSLP